MLSESAVTRITIFATVAMGVCLAWFIAMTPKSNQNVHRTLDEIEEEAEDRAASTSRQLSQGFANLGLLHKTNYVLTAGQLSALEIVKEDFWNWADAFMEGNVSPREWAELHCPFEEDKDACIVESWGKAVPTKRATRDIIIGIAGKMIVDLRNLYDETRSVLKEYAETPNRTGSLGDAISGFLRVTEQKFENFFGWSTLGMVDNKDHVENLDHLLRFGNEIAKARARSL